VNCPILIHYSRCDTVIFRPDGKTLAFGSDDKTIRLWDIPFYFMFLENAKPTRLFFTFAEGVQFFWQVGRVELEFMRQVKPTLYPQGGYYFRIHSEGMSGLITL
jgi:hypothetical protein